MKNKRIYSVSKSDRRETTVNIKIRQNQLLPYFVMHAIN